ncbi:hypothetical protein LVW35_21440 [Pseudomonas sp. HN11]|uniref:hypothetical protein n=1 Tax=Pseudomonas sp. HN11 TaxID=1344094 RepID=UPI001F47F831|nr:hypothetical protein [Pseudomonas sp. HN11]UII70206.1 hypothetical protein LVW35_21440 [Pseudomonas sp. HN11]
MTSVSNQQYAPYHANYEMRPKSVPNSNETAEPPASPSTESNSAPPRQPMNPQQRGQFSSHRGLVNSPASTPQPSPGQLAQLSQENNQLRDKLNQLVAQFTPIIMQMRQQVAELTQQLNKIGEPAKENSPSTPDVTERSKSGESPQASAPVENAPVSGQEVPRSLKHLTAENNQLRETVERLQTQFTAIVKQLQQQIQELNQKIGGPGTPPTQTAPENPDAHTSSDTSSDPASAGADTVTSNTQPSTQTDEPPSSESRTVDELMHDNKELRARIDQMITEFTQVISQLKQQIEELSARVKTQAA